MRTERGKKAMLGLRVPKRFVPVLLLVMLTACGGGGADSAASTPAPAPVVTPPVAQVAPGTWVVMGSSTAAGAGAPAGKSWVALLAAAYAESGVQVANIAKGGTVTYEGLSTAAPPMPGRPAADPAINVDQALSRKPALLIVSYPSNDTALGYSVDETVNNLLTIQSRALTAGVPVMIMSTQPRNLSDTQLAQMRAIDQRVMASTGDCFIDLQQILAGSDGRLASDTDSGDGVHPNEAGHALIAKRVVDVLKTGRCVRIPGA